ncbi:MAG: MarR family winged helix-turn-helix transcriptional regulator [Lachnospiraceae bacterium]
MVKKDIGYFIKNINDKLKARADADLKRYNLTFAQSRVLAFLNSKGGKATQKEIELFLEVSHPTVVGIVSRMEQNGHVISRLDETDKRNKIVKLTEQAKAIGIDLERNIFTNEQKMLATLSDEDIAQLKRMLTVIYQNLE